MLGVAVLAGFGIKFFLEKFKSAAAKILITILLSGLVLFEFWSYPPFKIVDLFRYPKVYDWLKTVKSDIVIAEYPLDIESTSEFYKFYQTRHGKRMINGSIPGSPANRFMQKLTKVSESNTTVTLKQLGVRYILVHKQLYLNTELIDWIEELKKIPSNSMLKLINQSEGIDVYEVF
jgi:hypothetical protein